VPNPFAKIPAFVKLFIRGWLLLMTADNAAAVELLGCFKKSCPDRFVSAPSARLAFDPKFVGVGPGHTHATVTPSCYIQAQRL
jgi:hypothetical protein